MPLPLILYRFQKGNDRWVELTVGRRSTGNIDRLVQDKRVHELLRGGTVSVLKAIRIGARIVTITLMVIVQL